MCLIETTFCIDGPVKAQENELTSPPWYQELSIHQVSTNYVQIDKCTNYYFIQNIEKFLTFS